VIGRLAGAADTDSLGDRADVRAARLALDAATADRQRATALLLPRVNSFGRLDWNSGDTPFGGRNAWTAGIMVTWSPFSGGAELAERRTAAARRSAAAATAEAAEARGRLELQEAANALEVALARMAITGRAVEQSGEAHRSWRGRHEGGLATAVEPSTGCRGDRVPARLRGGALRGHRRPLSTAGPGAASRGPHQSRRRER
jgi:outer membrane protein TolC